MPFQSTKGKDVGGPCNLSTTIEANEYPDSDSSWEVDTEVMPPSKDTAESSYCLPNELQGDGEKDEAYDQDDEMDHTGFWRDGDMEQLMYAVNHYRERLRGKFEGSGGGKERREAAWGKVAGK